jgi:hypothetical protein
MNLVFLFTFSSPPFGSFCWKVPLPNDCTTLAFNHFCVSCCSLSPPLFVLLPFTPFTPYPSLSLFLSLARARRLDEQPQRLL